MKSSLGQQHLGDVLLLCNVLITSLDIFLHGTKCMCDIEFTTVTM